MGSRTARKISQLLDLHDSPRPSPSSHAKDRSVWKQLVEIYNRKYGGDVGPLLESSGGCVFRVTPQIAFGQDEHAENFTDAVTRWQF